MKNHMRKLVSLILAFTLIISCFPTEVFAAAGAGWISFYSLGSSNGSGTGTVQNIEGTFAVYITNEQFKTPLLISQSDSHDVIVGKLKTQINNEYSSHYPGNISQGQPLYLAAGWTTTGQNIYNHGILTSPDLASGALLHGSQAITDNYVTSIGSTARATLTHSPYWTKAVAAYAGGDATRKAFALGWRNQINPATFSLASAQMIMAYLTNCAAGQTSFDIGSRLDTLLTSGATDAKTKDAQEWASYAELLMSVYVLAQNVKGSNKALAGSYATQIDNWMKSDTDVLTKNPALVCFETVNGFWSGSGHTAPFYFSDCTDLANWAVGGTTAINLRKNPGASNNTLNMIESVRTKNYAAQKNNSSTYIYGKNKFSIFTMDIQALTGFKFSSAGTTRSSTYPSPYYGVIHLNSASYSGLSVAFSRMILPTLPDVMGRQDISCSPPKEEIAGDVIGKVTPIVLECALKDQSRLQAWILNDSTHPGATYKIRINVNQTSGPSVGSIQPSGGAPALNTEVAVTFDKLKTLFNGTGYTYNAQTQAQSIATNQTITYGFQSIVEVWCSYDASGWFPLAPDDGLATKTYFKDDSISFTSDTTPNYGEVKSNFPEQEQWEAMAGHPSTEQLYYAVGGHEFLVDVQLEYVPDCTTTRQYTTVYNSVPDGCNTPSQSRAGPAGKSAPSLPAPVITPADCNGKTISIPWTVSNMGEATGHDTYDSKGNFISHITDTYNWQFNNPGYNKTVGGYSKTWSQTVNYDYMKIKQAMVYEINNGQLVLASDSASTIGGGTSQIKATIKQGQPSVFANIDRTNTAAGGRVKWTLETAQGDHVTWNMGPSDNADINNETSGAVIENNGYTANAAKMTGADVVSDTLILQTSSGDQAVMYFAKHTSGDVTCGTGIGANGTAIQVEKVGKDAMWTNNSTCASHWTGNQINIGSYNGKYSNPNTAYTGNGNRQSVSTVLDDYSPFISRPSRPSSNLIIAGTWMPDKLTPNGEYNTSDDDNQHTHTATYAMVYSKDYTANRIDSDISGESSATRTYDDEYYSGAGDVNNIVIHDPVSAQDAMVVPLDSARDQRIDGKNVLGGSGLNEVQTVVKKVLDPAWRSNLLFNPSAENSQSQANFPLGWKSGAWSGNSSEFTFTRRQGDQYVINGSASFEIRYAPTVATDNAFNGSIYQEVDCTAGESYSLTGKLASHRAYASVDVYGVDSVGKLINSTMLACSAKLHNAYTPQDVSLNFVAPEGAVKLLVEMRLDSGAADEFTTYGYYLFADDLVLHNMSRTGFIQNTNVIKDYTTITNPVYLDYLAHPEKYQSTWNYGFTGGDQPFTAPKDATYTISAWGSQGGNSGGLGGFSRGSLTLSAGQVLKLVVGGTNGYGGGGGGRSTGGGYSGALITSGTPTTAQQDFNYTGSVQPYTAPYTGLYTFDVWGAQGADGDQVYGGRGGYSHGQINLTQGQVIYVYTGGAGVPGYPGFNGGGGSSHSWSPGGGGASDIRLNGTDWGNRIIVAGGGGGAEWTRKGNGGYGGGLSGGNSSEVVGGTQTSGSWGQASTYGSNDVGGGGGGGYYAGTTNRISGCGSGGGGSGYVGGVANGYTYAGNQTITAPAGYQEVGHSGNGFIRIAYSGYTINPIILAGGGGGGNNVGPGGFGGGLTGGTGVSRYGRPGTGGTQWGGGTQGTTGGGASLGGAPGGYLFGGTASVRNNDSACGGGGGYYGGGSGSHDNPDDADDGSGGGGSGYVGGVGNAVIQGGNEAFASPSGYTEVGHSGNGYLRISAPVTIPQQYISGWADADTQPETEAPDSAYITSTETINPDHTVSIPGKGTFQPGNFINLDHEFQVYYPNIGDFDEGGQFGIRRPSDQTGLGFTDGMDTTKWISRKVVKFDFNVIYNGTMYPANTEIILFDQDRDSGVDVGKANGYTYTMYCVEGNLEARDAPVDFYSIATNSPTGEVDNDRETNVDRYSNLAARHSADKSAYIDVVGRIGNMTIMDTGDWRFSNFFKQSTGSMQAQTGVPIVDSSKQKNYVGPLTNILGHIADDGVTGVPVSTASKFTNNLLEQTRYQFVLNNSTKLREYTYFNYDRWSSLFQLTNRNKLLNTNWLDTYGGIDYKNSKQYAFPLTAAYNDSKLATQPLRIGYNSYMDVETIGSYADGFVQVVPYYYKLNLDMSAPVRNAGESEDAYSARCISVGYIVPVDIYMSVNGSYKNINKFGVVNSSWDPSETGLPADMRFYANTVSIDWNDEQARRQVSDSENTLTQNLCKTVYPDGYNEDGTVIPNGYPIGDYHAYGNNQYLVMNGRNRTLIGNDSTYGAGVGSDNTNNPGGSIAKTLYQWQGQRWNFSMGLPSSAVTLDLTNGVTHQSPTTNGFENSRKGNWVLVTALDVQSVGSMWILQNDCVNTSTTVGLRGNDGNVVFKDYDISGIPQKVVTVSSLTKSSLDDMMSVGTH